MLRQIAIRATSLAAILALLCGGVAVAAGRETVTETEHVHREVVFSEVTANPCNGEPGTLTVVGNSIFHVTFFANGDESWATGTLEGVATFVPANPSGVSASGHFTTWFGGAQNNKNEVEHHTNTVNLKGSDGSRIVMHGNSHTSTNAAGEVTVSFERERVTCG
ncbi:MAG TPA: hypothetical protein VGN08_08960 [Solirubrobacteraceae bacterium]